MRIVSRICGSKEFVRRSGEDGDGGGGGGGGGCGGGGEILPVLLYREPSLVSYTCMLIVWEMFACSVVRLLELESRRTSSSGLRDGRTFFCPKFWRGRKSKGREEWWS